MRQADSRLIAGANPAFAIMPQKLLNVLKLGRCSHEFSWPRRDSSGRYYQVCLLCAAEYNYDWKTMRRTERVDSRETSVHRPSHTREARPTWTPRARRLKVDLAVRYRAKNMSTWYTGVIDNISQSGVLFHGNHHFPVDTLVEMVFEMPEEISGQKESRVLCQGRVIRHKAAARSKERPDLAATILDYKFLRKPQV
jgi:hypothetical protein